MPIARLWSRLFRLAAAASLAGAVAVPAQAQVMFGYFHPGIWDHYLALPVYYAFPYIVGFPGHASSGRWVVAGSLQGAAGRLHLP